jgi:hypothetical protein
VVGDNLGTGGSQVSSRPGDPHPHLISKAERDQKVNIICKSMLRFADGVEKNPPARALDFPKSGDKRTPTGGARLTLLKIFLPCAVKVNE